MYSRLLVVSSTNFRRSVSDPHVTLLASKHLCGLGGIPCLPLTGAVVLPFDPRSCIRPTIHVPIKLVRTQRSSYVRRGLWIVAVVLMTNRGRHPFKSFVGFIFAQYMPRNFRQFFGNNLSGYSLPAAAFDLIVEWAVSSF